MHSFGLFVPIEEIWRCMSYKYSYHVNLNRFYRARQQHLVVKIDKYINEVRQGRGDEQEDIFSKQGALAQTFMHN